MSCGAEQERQIYPSDRNEPPGSIIETVLTVRSNLHLTMELTWSMQSNQRRRFATISSVNVQLNL